MVPRISVVIPCRNGVDLLPRAVASVLAMPVADLEVIIVDDGSTDGTGDWIAAQHARDPRVVGLRRDSNHGAANARNAGIAAARAPVLGFLDDDDIWLPGPMAERLAWHEAHPQTVLSFSDYVTLLPDGTLQARYVAYCPRFRRFVAGRSGIFPLGEAGFSLLAGENPICTSSVMASRAAVQAVGGFDVTLKQAEDWDLWIRLAKYGPVATSTRIELHHFARPGSLSSKVAERVAYLSEVVRRHRPYAWRRAPGAALAGNCLVAQARAELAMRRQRSWAAFMHLAIAAAWQPSLQHFKDAARGALVVAGVKPILPTSHAATDV